ncbi:hypothetical protein EW026_g5634 [Hermanssonia centrifuga]|uniref:Uncharacterized protein n=1 Tax=Hermanssonia centrifuga TaxID=98765 RepID=A0A4V3X9Z9_9APHY|nr:hypothetical protein EW026_g5634 [Hermanssonia centrifuga]
MSQPHACAQLFLPAEDSERAIRAALTENPKNATYFSAPTPDGVAADAGMGGAPMALALSVRKMWAAGRTLRVSLRGGSEIVRSKVKQFAATWSQHANIHFEFVAQEPAEIRVGFEMNGRSWSYVGTDCLTIAAADPTMNLGWFTDVTPDDKKPIRQVHSTTDKTSGVKPHTSLTITHQKYTRRAIAQFIGRTAREGLYR